MRHSSLKSIACIDSTMAKLPNGNLDSLRVVILSDHGIKIFLAKPFDWTKSSIKE